MPDLIERLRGCRIACNGVEHVITESVTALEAMRDALRLTLDHLGRNVEIIYGPGHDISMAAGAQLVERAASAALSKLDGKEGA